MGLLNLDVKHSRNRWHDQLGVEQWIVTYTLPNGRVASERINYRVGLANLLPWADDSDHYAPCIHDSVLDPDPERADAQILTVLYQRPSESMILRPGRGMVRLGSYSTTVVEEEARFDDGQSSGVVGGTTASTTFVKLERVDVLKVEERAIVKVIATDWADEEQAVYARALDWIGYGGEFTYGKLLLDNLKLAAIDFRRDPNDVSVLRTEWQFARKADGWRVSGVIEDERYTTDLDGKEVEYDPDADPPVQPSGSFMSLKLRNTDSDVIRGTKDFTPMQEYLTWNT